MDCGQIYKQINKYLISNPLNKYNYRQSWRLNSYEIAAKRTQPRNLSPTLTKSLEFIYPGYKQIRLTNRTYPKTKSFFNSLTFKSTSISSAQTKPIITQTLMSTPIYL
jgi:hypothetical protein